MMVNCLNGIWVQSYMWQFEGHVLQYPDISDAADFGLYVNCVFAPYVC